MKTTEMKHMHLYPSEQSRQAVGKRFGAAGFHQLLPCRHPIMTDILLIHMSDKGSIPGQSYII